MDCGLVRERLDAARPGASDREDPELQSAFAHLDECESCAEAFEFRRAFDRKFGEVVRAVEVPPDLEARILRSLEPLEVRPAEPSDPSGARRKRRAWLLTASATVLLAAFGWTWHLMHVPPAPLTSTEVFEWWRDRLARGVDVDSLPAFDAEFDPAPADGRWSKLATAPPRGADLDGDGVQDAAVHLFRGGFLVVMAPGRVSDPPSAASALAATRHYSPAPHLAWTSAGRMHLCFVPNSRPEQLEQLVRYLHRAAA